MKSVIRFILFFIIPIALFILWIGGYFSPRIEPGYAKEEVKEVVKLPTVKVTSQKVYRYYQIDGSVVSDNNAKVATKLMARILKINVKEGDYVKKGQLLAVLDDSEIRQNIKEAKAGLEELSKAREEALSGLKGAEAAYQFAKRTYERFKNLYRENAVSKQQLEEIETKMIGAKAQVDAIKAKLKQLDAKEKQVRAKLKYAQIMQSYAYIKAPFDGVIIKKMNDVGDMAAPGMPLFVIGDKNLKFISMVDESLINKVNVGDTVDLFIDTVGKKYSAKIVEKSNSIDPMNRTFTVKAQLPQDSSLKPGMYGKMRIKIGEEKKILVPATAVTKWGQLDAVYTVDEDGVAHLTFVKTGETVNGKVEIISGLKEGMEIVASDVDKACEGCKVR
ncbi:efflux RND transporter periplasmic adaptor subunit [Persephonella atlantica]|uniref:Efflux RND transporter periplasmic adaptor subunit n=1 Tax=Persephonella atlantica TaxID=2699429 RepID=A0ABS1GG54_9AQUI|nr:efflux RND transporter periplasmic adaptor subunit [Persephonella atlantica]MBK3331906.1 efflux RND transporter periplasmic adaptor subunit [Persephonella atlantica]